MNDMISRQAAIDALTDDLISRQAAIDALTDEAECEPWDYSPSDAILTIKALPSTQPEREKLILIRAINAGIVATSTKDIYSCGMRNGMRWCKALFDDKKPNFEDASQYVNPERKIGKWKYIHEPFTFMGLATWKCSICEYDNGNNGANFCPNCGADMRGAEE